MQPKRNKVYIEKQCWREVNPYLPRASLVPGMVICPFHMVSEWILTTDFIVHVLEMRKLKLWATKWCYMVLCCLLGLVHDSWYLEAGIRVRFCRGSNRVSEKINRVREAGQCQNSALNPISLIWKPQSFYSYFMLKQVIDKRRMNWFSQRVIHLQSCPENVLFSLIR